MRLGFSGLRACVVFVTLSIASHGAAELPRVDASTTAEWNSALEEGRTHAKAGRFADAERTYSRSLQLAEQLGDAGKVANTLTHLGIVYREQEKFREAEPLFTRALELFRRQNDLTNVAIALNNVASIRLVTGHMEEAETLYREALNVGQTAPRDMNRVTSAANLATLIAKRGDFPGALKLLEDVRDKAASDTSPSDAVAVLFNQLGVLYRKLARYAEAEQSLRRSLEMRVETLGEGHVDTAIAKNNLGDLYAIQGRYVEAEPLLAESARACRKMLGESSRCASMMINLGSLEQNTGRKGEAETHFRDAIALTDANPLANLTARAAAMNNLAKLLASERRFSEAKGLYERAIAAWEQAHATNNPDYASTLTNIGSLYLTQKNYGSAGDMMRRALALDEKLLGPNHWKVAVDLNNLATVLVRLKQYAEAEAMLRRSISLESRAVADGMGMGRELANLGEVLALQKKYEEAAQRYGEAFEIWEKNPHSEPENVLVLMARYEQILREIHEYAKAEEVASRAMRIRVKSAIEKSFVATR